MNFTKQEILEILAMPRDEYRAELMPKARACTAEHCGEAVLVTAMLGFTNICKNHCLYCGMRADNCTLARYRMREEDIIAAGLAAADSGFGRIFLVSGEDPLFPFDALCRAVAALHKRGMFVSLACGEFSEAQYAELRAAGADEYAVKFEMSREESFNRLNPSTDYRRRMAAIDAVQKSGMQLASGNIVGWPGQSREELAEDILLMQKLRISWAPLIPYMPVKGTPLAEEGGAGDRYDLLKELSILRLMLPTCRITATQPGDDLREGLASVQGNADAVAAGGNLIFFDLLPSPTAKAFRVIDNRNITGTGHIRALADKTGLMMDTEAYRVKKDEKV